ncbi:copper resistance D family protein [Fictibacillus fluitans]|uniref:CopD family protein n=1 Tax=Fictibacillus fluitans TaxID=3058422 RepID=A0ABT8HXS5_9BACL|nr:CopD family protein [Fictibacillus sp. NE201]MDN4525585.1 CopD family protein [Fictibacillus sp. NE201]
MLFVAKAVLYLVFSLFIGTFILYSISDKRRPPIHVSKKGLLLWIALIPVTAFSQVLELALSLGKDFGFWPTLNDILFSFDIGKGWFFILALSLLIFVMVYFNEVSKDRFLSRLSLGIGVVLIIAIGYTSHAASLNQWGGLFAHALHFLAVTGWTGTLLIVSWFSKDREKLSAFFKWFTPYALICLLATIGGGIWLMNYIVPEYFNSWMIDYGQALLIKHILLIVVIFYAGINTIWVRKNLADTSFAPYRWMRLEGIILLIIFAVTGFMTQQEPPHDVSQTLAFQKPSKLFTAFVEDKVNINSMVEIVPTMAGAGLLAVALLLLAVSYFTIRRNVSVTVALLLTLGAAVSFYLAVMFSVFI